MTKKTRPWRWVHSVRRWIVALLAVPLVFAGLGVAPAQAATLDGMLSFGGYHVGAFRSSSGELAYCLEQGMDAPFSDQQTPRRVETLRGYTTWSTDNWGWNGQVTTEPASGELLRQINWLLSEHGNTTDAGKAAEVQIAVWLLREGPGNRAWMDAKLGYLRENGAADHVDRGYQLAADARKNAVGPSNLDPSSLLRISEADAHGSGTVTYPANTTRLQLDGATFENGSSTLTIPKTSQAVGGTVSWTAALHDSGWKRFHRVTVSGDWSYTEKYWPSAVILHPPTRDGEQLLGAGVSPVTHTVAGTLKPAAVRVDSRFTPTIATQVPERFVERATGAFSDTVTIGVEGSVPWPTRDDGTQVLPLVADGVLYGPFLTQQAESASPPQGAPIAARSSIAVDRGPGTYTAVGTGAVREAGYYYWVWRIAEEEQADDVRASELLESDAIFADRFGLTEEGQVVATALEWETRLDRHELTLDDRQLRDSIRVRLRDGGWLRGDDGMRVPARIRLTLYEQDTEPIPEPHLPAFAREIDSVLVEVTDENEWIDAEAFTVPFETRGWVSVQACLMRDDQDEGYRDLFVEGCDNYGLPAETARIVVPEVRTEATPRVTVGEEMRDRAFVTGPVPHGAELHFTYYLAPEHGAPKYNEDWQPLRDDDGMQLHWSADEISRMEPAELCLAQPVAATAPMAIDREGEFESAAVTARSAGTGYWVERLTVPHPETGESVIVHEGECGIENERTIINEPAPPVLARTGASGQVTYGAIGVGFVGLGMIALGLVRLRSRSRL